MPISSIFVWLSVFYVIGVLVNFFIRGYFAVHSDVNKIDGYSTFFKKNWDTMAIRALIGYGLFCLWFFNPGLISKYVSKIPGVPDTIANWLTIPPTLGTSVLYGVNVDVVLDFIQSFVANNKSLSWIQPIVKGRIPTYNEAVVNVQAIKQMNEDTPTEDTKAKDAKQ